MSVVVGKIGSPGLPWVEIQGNLCCFEAEEKAGIPGACSGTTGGHQGGNCFASDPGMGSTNREGHYNWAQGQDASRLEANLKSKINLLYNCPSLSDDGFANAFADFSVIISQNAPNAACFGNDRGVISTDRNGHYQWARTKSRQQLFQNLQWKMIAAFKCLDSAKQKTFFADISVPIAKTSPASETNTGGNKRKDNGGVRTCDANERAAFAKMAGSWKAGGPKITISGSCEQSTGTTQWAEYCGDPDTSSDAKYQSTFTGRMEGGSLQVNWDLPAQGPHKAFQGTGSCQLNSDGTLSCSGFRCGVGGRKQ